MNHVFAEYPNVCLADRVMAVDYILSQVVKDLHKVCPVGASSWEDYFTVMEVDKAGDQRWKLHGRLHRGGDKPAYIWARCMQEWYQHGKLHRDGDRPAVVCANGHQEWWQHGKHHRDGGKPIIVWANDM